MAHHIVRNVFVCMSSGAMLRMVPLDSRCGAALEDLEVIVGRLNGGPGRPHASVLAWLCEFLIYMMNRMEVAFDREITYESVKGQGVEVLGLEFCEDLLWNHHPGKRMEKMIASWSFGLFLGVCAKTGELNVDSETRGGPACENGQEESGGTEVVGRQLGMDHGGPMKPGQSRQRGRWKPPGVRCEDGSGEAASRGGEAGDPDERGPEDHAPGKLRKAEFDKHGYSDRCVRHSAI